nr:copper chaperone PCu(A)C [uncultured Cohaesibacter sp.]
MKKLIIGAMVMGLSCLAAEAAEWKVGDITVSAPFARASAGMANAGGGFMQITNEGDADRLIAASADVGKMTELHTHIKDGDVMRMRQVDAIDVPAHGEVALKPGSYHVMFMKLKAPLKKGETFPLELTFEKAGKVTIEVPVAGIGAKAAPKM